MSEQTEEDLTRRCALRAPDADYSGAIWFPLEAAQHAHQAVNDVKGRALPAEVFTARVQDPSKVGA